MFFVNISNFLLIFYTLCRYIIFPSILYFLHRYIIFFADMSFSLSSHDILCCHTIFSIVIFSSVIFYFSRQIIFFLDMFCLDMSLLDMSFLDIEYNTFPASSISKFYFFSPCPHKNGTSNRITRSEMPFLFSLLANSSFVNYYIILQYLQILL